MGVAKRVIEAEYVRDLQCLLLEQQQQQYGLRGRTAGELIINDAMIAR